MLHPCPGRARPSASRRHDGSSFSPRVCAGPGPAGASRRCCAGSVRCSSTRSRCWPGRTSWWRTPVLATIGRDRVERAYWGTRERYLRVLVPRGLRATARGLAGLRRDAPVLAGQGASAGTCSRTTTRAAPRCWRACGPRARSPRTSSAGPRRAARGGTGPRPRSRPSGCSTSVSSSAANAAASPASTTWPSAPSRPICWSQEWSDDECALRLVTAAGRSLGVATEADLAVYHGLPRPLVRRVLPSTALAPVAVEGWAKAAYADPDALGSLGTRARGRTVLLSPFDSLIWYRERLERLFGLRHRLEAYTPKAKRIFGYFAMPVLAGTPDRRRWSTPAAGRDVLVAKQVTLLDPAACGARGTRAGRRGDVGRVHAGHRRAGRARVGCRGPDASPRAIGLSSGCTCACRGAPRRGRRRSALGVALGDPLEHGGVAAEGSGLRRVVQHESGRSRVRRRGRPVRRTGPASRAAARSASTAGPCRCSTGHGRRPAGVLEQGELAPHRSEQGVRRAVAGPVGPMVTQLRP